MRLSVALSALAAALFWRLWAPATHPRCAQDFSITNQVEPANPVRRDLMRQLQAWWTRTPTIPDTRLTTMRVALSKSV